MNNVVIAFAGVVAETNAAADAENAQLQAEVMQLRAALAQHQGVAKGARALLRAEELQFDDGRLVAEVKDRTWTVVRTVDLEALREALKGCP